MSRLGISTLLVLILCAGVARAAPAIVLGGPSRCPSPEAVAEVLGPLVPGFVVRVAPPSSAPDAALILDEETSYSVMRAGWGVRRFEDGERKCGERAKAVAVFMALVAGPASFATQEADDTAVTDEPKAASEAPPPPASVPPPVAVEKAAPRARYALATDPDPRRLHLDLEASALLDGGQAATLSGGGKLRLVAMWRFVGGAIGFGAYAPMRRHYTAVDASILRVPIELSLRLGHRWGGVELSGELGAAIAATEVWVSYLPGGPKRWTTEAGIRAALELRVWLTRRIALTAGAEIVGVPVRQPLFAYGPGSVGAMPSYWASGQLGIAMRIR